MKLSDLEDTTPSIMGELLYQHFGRVFELSSVFRESKGIVHGILVAKLDEQEMFALRIVEYPIVQGEFRQSNIAKKKAKQLACLGRNYPTIKFVENDEIIISIQEFIPGDVALFDRVGQYEEMARIIILASKCNIVLDYNDNHWIWYNMGLYYVDQSYGQLVDTPETALLRNVDQMTILLREGYGSIFGQFLRSKIKESGILGQSQLITHFNNRIIQLSTINNEAAHLKLKEIKDLVHSLSPGA